MVLFSLWSARYIFLNKRTTDATGYNKPIIYKLSNINDNFMIFLIIFVYRYLSIFWFTLSSNGVSHFFEMPQTDNLPDK